MSITKRRRSADTNGGSHDDDNDRATKGARLTYAEVYSAGAPRDPLPEVYEPNIVMGESNKEVLVVPAAEEGDNETLQTERVFVCRTENPSQVYQLFGKPSIILENPSRPANWGEVHFAVVLSRVPTPKSDDGVPEPPKFRKPSREEAKFVAIKKLNKRAVQSYLDQGGHEDPYKEIARMQELGDDYHVLTCTEALQDAEHLYIVTPMSTEGSLLANIPMGTGYPEKEAQRLFKNILEILLYLEHHGIFHHDLSPDNLLFLHDGRLVLFDFAMSMRIPKDGDKRFLIKPQGAYGTPPCQPPELFSNKTPFDGIAADLWAAAVMLYTLLTGHFLFRLPHWSDILFRYYILAGGLHPGLNEQLVEILEEAFQPGQERDQNSLMSHAMANLNLSPNARDLLIHLLKLKAWERYTLMQAVESPWVQSDLP